jgi:hypothetical protein
MTTDPLNIFPGAGGNWQEIMTRCWSPNISLNFAGNAGVEREVNEEVASDGRQIGWLDDIVLTLAEAAAPQTLKKADDSLTKLKQAADKIAEIKKRRSTSALSAARDALDRLKAADKTAYDYLISTLQADRSSSAA